MEKENDQSEKTFRQQVQMIEKQRKKIEDLSDENDLLRQVNKEMKDQLSKTNVLRERAEYNKVLERKITSLQEELGIVRQEKDLLKTESSQLKFKATMSDVYNRELDSYKAKLDELLFQIECLEQEKQDLTANLSRYESVEMSNLRLENDRLRTANKSRVIGESLDNSMNMSLMSEIENQPAPQAVEPLLPLENPWGKNANYLMFARTHIKYIDAETKLAQRERSWDKERKAYEDRIRKLLSRPADISLLDHESTALAENVQRLEKENNSLKSFKNRVQKYIFQAKDSNESSIMMDMIQDLIDI